MYLHCSSCARVRWLMLFDCEMCVRTPSLHFHYFSCARVRGVMLCDFELCIGRPSYAFLLFEVCLRTLSYALRF